MRHPSARYGQPASLAPPRPVLSFHAANGRSTCPPKVDRCSSACPGRVVMGTKMEGLGRSDLLGCLDAADESVRRPGLGPDLADPARHRRRAGNLPVRPRHDRGQSPVHVGHTPPGRTLVADSNGQILGTANMYANRPGPGKHIASGSFMVDRAARGRGVGVESSKATSPPRSCTPTWGFVTIGTVPGAFNSHEGPGRSARAVPTASLDVRVNDVGERL